MDDLIRRHWPVAGALLMFVAFLLGQWVWFHPQLERWQKLRREAADLGLALDSGGGALGFPPRLQELLSHNTLSPAAADEQGASGLLTARLLAELARRASARGLQVVSTEQIPVLQLADDAQVRAHIVLRGRFADVAAFLDDLGSGAGLYSVDRFALSGAPGAPGGPLDFELWVTQVVIKVKGAHA